MSKPTIILADTDANYISSLELKFIGTLDERINLEIITDRKYFNEYFSIPRTAEILAVSDELYSEELHKHNISNICVLIEKPESGDTEDLEVKSVYKYSSLKEIYNEIIGMSSNPDLRGNATNTDTQVIMVYSPIGGAGKTSVAIGLSTCLAANKRVLYVDAEEMNTFSCLLAGDDFISANCYSEFRADNSRMYLNVKPQIRTERFSYLPPFKGSLSSTGISMSAIIKFIEFAKASKDYDYIVVDADSTYSDEKAELMSLANKVFMIVMQDKVSAHKMNVLLHNANCTDAEKYIFICNRYIADAPNYIVSTGKKKYIVSEFIAESEGFSELDAEKYSKISGFQNLALMLL